jgi:hypothetical protein
VTGNSITGEDNRIIWSHEMLRTSIDDEIFRPELISLKTCPESNGSHCYLGRIAYLERSKSDRGMHTVIKDSFRLSRRRVIVDILAYLSNPKFNGVTIDEYAGQFTIIIDWIDSHVTYDFAESIENARMAYTAYTGLLQAKIKLGDIKPITAATAQRYCRYILNAIFPDENMHSEVFKKIPLLKRGRKEQREAPDKDVVDHQVSLFINILKQFTEHLTQEKPFPWHFSCDDFSSYVLPHINMTYISTPFNKTRKRAYAFDFETGLVRKPNEITHLLPNRGSRPPTIDQSRHCIKSMRKTLDKANSDPHSKPRKFFGTLSMQAYLLLFMHATGSNFQTVADLKFDGIYELSKDEEFKEFRTIKFRSGGVEVSYTIGREALKLFRIYLKLRNWLLGDLECEYLFFNYEDGPNSYNLPSRINSAITNNFHCRLEGTFISKGTEVLNSSKLRVFKSDTLDQIGEDITTTSKLLQHSDIKTTAANYAGGNKQRQEEEFANYWEAIDTIISTDKDSSVKIPSGSCSDYGKPIPIVVDTPIEPSCELPQGCLFCEKYLAHAEKEDIYKLMSVQYFLETILEQFPDLEHAVSLYGDLLDRIKDILTHMEAINKSIAEVVKKARAQVFDHHDIHQFWDLKLQRLDRLGVLLV